MLDLWALWEEFDNFREADEFYLELFDDECTIFD